MKSFNQLTVAEVLKLRHSFAEKKCFWSVWTLDTDMWYFELPQLHESVPLSVTEPFDPNELASRVMKKFLEEKAPEGKKLRSVESAWRVKNGLEKGRI